MAMESVGLLHGGVVVTCTRALLQLTLCINTQASPCHVMLSYPWNSSVRLIVNPKYNSKGKTVAGVVMFHVYQENLTEVWSS